MTRGIIDVRTGLAVTAFWGILSFFFFGMAVWRLLSGDIKDGFILIGLFLVTFIALLLMFFAGKGSDTI